MRKILSIFTVLFVGCFLLNLSAFLKKTPPSIGVLTIKNNSPWKLSVGYTKWQSWQVYSRSLSIAKDEEDTIHFLAGRKINFNIADVEGSNIEIDGGFWRKTLNYNYDYPEFWLAENPPQDQKVKLALKSYHKTYLGADQDKSIVKADAKAIGAWEKWEIVFKGKKPIKYQKVIRIKSVAWGTYLRAGDSRENWTVNQTTSKGPWGKWTIVNADDPEKKGPINKNEKVAFKSVHNRYLTAEQDGRARNEATILNIWEKWKMKDVNPNIS